MHCVSAYPCMLENVNLKRMQYFKKLSKIIGYSGHLPGVEDAIASISQGCLICGKTFHNKQKITRKR